MTPNARYGLRTLKRRYVALRFAEIIMLSLGTILLAMPLLRLVTSNFIISLILSVVAGLAVLLSRMISYKLLTLTDYDCTRYLNDQYPQMQESADLLLRDDQLLSGL